MWRLTHWRPRRPARGGGGRASRTAPAAAGKRGFAVDAVAPQAHAVARRLEPARVRVVAIGAAHTGGVHPALAERPINVDLVALLAVRVVQAGLLMRAGRCCRAAVPALGVGMSSLRREVAGGADLDLGRRAGRPESRPQEAVAARHRLRPVGGPGPRASSPNHGTTGSSRWAPSSACRRHRPWRRSASRSRWCGGRCTSCCRSGSGPVQCIVAGGAFSCRGVEPALLVRVPGDRQRFAGGRPRWRSGTAAAGRRRTSRRSRSRPSSRPGRRCEVLAVAAEKRVVTPWCVKRGVLEVAAHRLQRRRGHRHEVVRLRPRVGGVPMATHASTRWARTRHRGATTRRWRSGAWQGAAGTPARATTTTTIMASV